VRPLEQREHQPRERAGVDAPLVVSLEVAAVAQRLGEVEEDGRQPRSK
jgi:hypothetical protein